MDNTAVLLVVLALGMAVMISVPGVFLFVRSLIGEKGKDVELRAELEAVRRELALVRADRDRLQVELAGVKARLTELEQTVATYQELAGASRRRRSPVRAENLPPLSAQRDDVSKQLQVVESQITAAGGDKRAPAELITHRDDLKAEIRRLESELDAL